ncbi:hypothetical protein MFIFM68171_08478 [Madurella fahalii]|uniref:Rhodopsin domain-containing protein n=1 Tax=Madurella fahalii TaxID=1157608 RepID=A0ABQ0GKI2_9PEZI
MASSLVRWQLNAFILDIITTVLAILAVTVRYIGTRTTGRRYGGEDFCVAVATSCIIAFNSIGIWAIVTADDQPFSRLPPETLTSIFKALYAAGHFYIFNQLTTKLSILLLYHRAFGVKYGISRRYTFAITTLGVVLICWTISASLTLFLQCQPVQKYWAPATPGWCFDMSIHIVVFEFTNAMIDFAMVALVVMMLSNLTLERSTKWRLGFLLALGGFVGVASLIKIVACFAEAENSLVLGASWCSAQMFCSILCCCMPMYHLMLRKVNTSDIVSGWSWLGWLRSRAAALRSRRIWPLRGNGGSTASQQSGVAVDSLAVNVGTEGDRFHGLVSWGWRSSPPEAFNPAVTEQALVVHGQSPR